MLRTTPTSSQPVERNEHNIDIHTRKLQMRSYKSIDLEARSRRNNLIFWGISENIHHVTCQDLIQKILQNELEIDPSEICIERAHRLGTTRNTPVQYKDDPKRPIIVRFRDYYDTDTIIEHAYRLRGTNFRIDRDYPIEIVDARKHLNQMEQTRTARVNREKIQIRYPAKLYINGRPIKNMFPEWFDILRESRTTGFQKYTTTSTKSYPQ